MQNNTILAYDKTFNKIKVSDDYSHPAKIYDLRKAADIHKKARKYIMSIIKPNMKYIDICNLIENKVGVLCKEYNL